MQREKGSLTSKACTGCRATLALTEQADGSTAYESCATCYPVKAKPAPSPKPVTERASAAVVPTREVGTSTTKENE